jgi:hypothetical protein
VALDSRRDFHLRLSAPAKNKNKNKHVSASVWDVDVLAMRSVSCQREVDVGRLRSTPKVQANAGRYHRQWSFTGGDTPSLPQSQNHPTFTAGFYYTIYYIILQYNITSHKNTSTTQSKQDHSITFSISCRAYRVLALVPLAVNPPTSPPPQSQSQLQLQSQSQSPTTQAPRDKIR